MRALNHPILGRMHHEMRLVTPVLDSLRITEQGGEAIATGLAAAGSGFIATRREGSIFRGFCAIEQRLEVLM